MSIVVLGALIGLIVVVMALGGSKMARQALIFIVILMAVALLASWYFLQA
jgi:hypothetical protein